MGLDMYAYAIKAELIGNQQVDIPCTEIVERAAGITPLPEDAYAALSTEGKEQYWSHKQALMARAIEEGVCNMEFAYWRKFNHLHGWMGQLYRQKGGTSDSFNCDTVRLMPEDFDALEQALQTGLPHMPGFFFGGAEIYEGDLEYTREFIARSRQAIADGMAIIYSSWW